jgi:hypothetical protein
MGLAYYKQASGGDTSSNRTLKIWQYPNTSDEDNECENGSRSALEDACEQLLNAWSIDGYTIYINYDYPNVDTSGRDAAHSSFQSYLEGKNPPVGVHLLVSGDFQDGESQGGDGTGNTSFSTWNTAVAGIQYYPKELWMNGVIHESLHSAIDNELSNVNEMGEHGAHGNTEHDFGKVIDYGDGQDISPMATAYLEEHSGHGDCARYVERTGYTTELTSCTKSAVSYTANNES